MADWTQQLAGARMQVDKRFEDRVHNSRFSNQEWGMIMTAVEWEIRQPGNAESAELVAVTDKIEDIMPELERIQSQMGNPGAQTQDSGGGLGARIGDLFDSLTGNGSAGADEARVRDAERLVQSYADELQDFLEERGRWDDVREAAAAERSPEKR
jgi:hypothetical protein